MVPIAAIPKPGSFNGPAVAWLLLLEHHCTKSTSSTHQRHVLSLYHRDVARLRAGGREASEVILGLAARDADALRTPEGEWPRSAHAAASSRVEPIHFPAFDYPKLHTQALCPLYADLLLYLVRAAYQIDAPAPSFAYFEQHLKAFLLQRALARDPLHPGLDASVHAAVRALLATAGEDGKSVTGKEREAPDSERERREIEAARIEAGWRLCLSHLLDLAILTPLRTRFRAIARAEDVSDLLADMAGSGGRASDDGPEKDGPEGAAGKAKEGWLVSSTNNNDLTLSQAGLHRRSFLGVQARRIRLRWIRLDFQQQEDVLRRVLAFRELALPSVSGSGGDVRLAYPEERLKAQGMQGLYGRGESDLEDRVEAYDDYVRAMKRGDFAATREKLSRFFDHAPHHAEHELHQHALINLAVFHLQSSHYDAAEAAVEEAIRRARHVHDQEANELCGALLDRIHALRTLSSSSASSRTGAPSSTTADTSLHLDPLFGDGEPQRLAGRAFDLETAWHVSLSQRVGAFGATEALNVLHELTWDYDGALAPAFLGGQEAARGGRGARSAAAARARRKRQLRKWEELRSAAAQQQQHPQGPTGGLTATSAAAAAAREAQKRKTGRKEPRASIARDAFRYEALQGAIWYALGFGAVADVLWDAALARVGPSGESGLVCANDVRIEALGGKAFARAEAGGYDEALELLLPYELIEGFSLVEYHAWVKRLWAVLWLRARRRGEVATMQRLKRTDPTIEDEVDGPDPGPFKSAPFKPVSLLQAEPQSARARTLSLLRRGRFAADLGEHDAALEHSLECVEMAKRFNLYPIQRSATLQVVELFAGPLKLPARAAALATPLCIACREDDNYERRGDAERAMAVVTLASAARRSSASALEEQQRSQRAAIEHLVRAQEWYAQTDSHAQRLACLAQLVQLHHNLGDLEGRARWHEEQVAQEETLAHAQNTKEVDPLVLQIEQIVSDLGEKIASS